MIKKHLLLAALTSLISSTTCIQAQEADSNTATKQMSNLDAYFHSHTPSKVAIPFETDEEFQARTQWWRDAKYGMFIHWGLYSILAGEYNGKVTPQIAEWIQRTLKIPNSEYKKLVKQFNPTGFNADTWVQLAKASGMKYIVLTAKHHDGFALFDSKVSKYDIMSTPYKKDIVKELSDACHKYGLKFGLYYSHVIDWDHPQAYIGEGKKLRDRMNTLDFDPKKMNRSIYLKEKAFPQLREILTNYGKIDILWYDMGGGLSNDEIRQFIKITRELQPETIVSSRVGATEVNPPIIDRGLLYDFFTPSDNYFTGNDLHMPWEMAGTTNGSWGYRKDDHEWRGKNEIVSSLVATASRNGNYLLNVGPDGKGVIPAEAAKNLLEAGVWIKKNSEAIFNTTGSPFPWNFGSGYITQKPQKLYLSVFDWPKSNKLQLNGLLSKVTSISPLNSREKLNFTQEGRFLEIDLTDIKKNDIATVFVVNYKGDKPEIAKGLTQFKDNMIRLDRITSNYLKDQKQSSWKFKVIQPGTYQIKLVSNEKARHSNPTWIGSKQEGSIRIAGNIIPVKLKRDSEKINKSLFFYKEITSNIGKVTFLKKGTYSLQLNGFEIGAGKWSSGLGLDRIDIVPAK